MKGPLIVEEDAAALSRRAAQFIADCIREAVSERGSASVALAGGSTPRATFDVLGGLDFAHTLPWRSVTWFFGDERAVPPHHPASNYRMAMDTLFASRRGESGRVHRMPAEAPGVEIAVREYGRLLPDPLDLLILGMGEDGHTASLFPGSPALDEREARVAVVTAPTAPKRRMTVTPPVIESARTLVVLASGEDKAAIIARARESAFDPHALPIQLALRGTWILDRAAASGLTSV
jgi:6-phosphogluconolactonase